MVGGIAFILFDIILFVIFILLTNKIKYQRSLDKPTPTYQTNESQKKRKQKSIYVKQTRQPATKLKTNKNQNDRVGNWQ